ncbi:MAG: lysophospholipid acyltransferase family protein [Acidobacteriota bacterium]
MNLHQRTIVYMTRPALRLMLHPFFRMTYFGAEHVPKAGPVLLAPNHQAYADPFWIGLPIRRPIHFMTWSRVFRVTYLRPLLRYFQCFPVDHDKPFDKRALKIAQELLRSGQVVMIFPEGGRTPHGDLQEFKAGAFRIAVKLQVPIVPITLNGGYEVWNMYRRLPRAGRITVHFHPPMYFSAHDRDLKEAAAEAARAVRDVIASKLQRPRAS